MLSGVLAADQRDGVGVPCLFRIVTGFPCPFCGATRASVAAVSLDASFWDYNIVWPPLLVVVTVAAVIRAIRPGMGRLEGWVTRRPLLSLSVALGTGWLAALINRSSIMT